MKDDKPNDKVELLGEFLRERSPSREEEETTLDRVRAGLPSKGSLPPLQATPTSANRSRWWLAAAAIIVFAVVGWGVRVRNASAAVVESVGGSLERVYENGATEIRAGEKLGFDEVIRSSRGTGAMLALKDGSKIEMRSNSKLALEKVDDGVRIRLDSGSVLVNASEQMPKHLSVRTKDVTVSVAGTVSLVDAEQSGSRVAVIQGEVAVQQGSTLKKLLPGEQVSSNPAMPSASMVEGLLWSRNVLAHLALLQQSIAVPPSIPDARVAAVEPLKFEVVSIKPLSNEGGFLRRFACQGSDGRVEFNPFAGMAPRASGPMDVPRGRCVGQFFASDLIALAYKHSAHSLRVRGGPDWARDSPRGQRYQLDAKAEDAANVTKVLLQQMLQTMLRDRFQLKFHIETEEAMAFDLLVASDGARLKEAFGEPELPHVVLNVEPLGGRKMIIAGKSSLQKLADFLLPFVSQGTTAYPVRDKTNLPGIYEYALALDIAEPGPRGGGGGGFRAALDSELGKLGLRLQLENVQVETIVIEEIQKPSEN